MTWWINQLMLLPCTAGDSSKPLVFCAETQLRVNFSFGTIRAKRYLMKKKKKGESKGRHWQLEDPRVELYLCLQGSQLCSQGVGSLQGCALVASHSWDWSLHLILSLMWMASPTHKQSVCNESQLLEISHQHTEIFPHSWHKHCGRYKVKNNEDVSCLANGPKQCRCKSQLLSLSQIW